MRIVLRGSPILAALFGHRQNGTTSDAPPLLMPGAAGDIQIGASGAGVKARRKDLTCEIENGVVSAIRVHSRRYKTEAGIGVGDSVIALANTYPIRWTGDHIAEVDDLKMKFQIEEERIVSILIS